MKVIAFKALVIDNWASNVEKLCVLNVKNSLVWGITVDMGALDCLHCVVLVEADENEMTMVEI